MTEGAFLLPEGRGEATRLTELSPELHPRHVLHEYGPQVRIAAAREEDAAYPVLLRLDADRAAAIVPAEMDPVGALGLKALDLRSSTEYVAGKDRRRFAGAPWDTEEATIPDPPAETAASAAPEVGAPGPPAEPMVGRIGVGLIIVDGPTPDLAFSDAERTLVVAEVQNGLGWYATQAPGGNLTWVYDIRPVLIDAAPNPNANDFEQLEALWRDPALAAIGFRPGVDGASDYVSALKSSLGVSRAYCAFFTKYPVAHFAYATIGGPRIVHQFDNDGWHAENIDRVFAHETGHIFGAPDEYAASNCDCGGSWGTSGTPNANCANCAPGGPVPCLMLANSWALCPATIGHIGW